LQGTACSRATAAEGRLKIRPMVVAWFLSKLISPRQLAVSDSLDNPSLLVRLRHLMPFWIPVPTTIPVTSLRFVAASCFVWVAGH